MLEDRGCYVPAMQTYETIEGPEFYARGSQEFRPILDKMILNLETNRMRQEIDQIESAPVHCRDGIELNEATTWVSRLPN